MPRRINLGNTGNQVTLQIARADNLMSIYLNPDVTNVVGMMKIYETVNFSNPVMGVTIDLESYLQRFTTVNGPTNIVLAVLMANFLALGPHDFTFSGPGMRGGAVRTFHFDLDPWSSEMQTFTIRAH